MIGVFGFRRWCRGKRRGGRRNPGGGGSSDEHLLDDVALFLGEWGQLRGESLDVLVLGSDTDLINLERVVTGSGEFIQGGLVEVRARKFLQFRT